MTQMLPLSFQCAAWKHTAGHLLGNVELATICVMLP